MKKHYLLSVVLALVFLFTNAQDVTVSGAGTASVNGDYTLSASIYTSSNGSEIKIFGGGWSIFTSGGTRVYAQGPGSYATPDLVPIWNRLSGGSNPTPTVSVYIPPYPGLGSGTEGDPYQISNLTELEFLSDESSYWDQNFIQTADINASATENWNSGDGFSPIGNSTTKFTGIYNGQGHTIDRLFITSSGVNKGLFGYCNGAEIKNLTLSEVTLTVDERNVGLLAGRVEASTIIDSINTSGTINSSWSGGTWASPGGIVGRLDASTLSNSSADVSITSLAGTTGGLVGYASSSSTITNCYSIGTINQNGIYHGAGGLVGSTDATAININNCYSGINITGINWTTTDDSFDGLGGLIGRVKGSLVSVDNCYSYGSVSSNMTTTSRISGLIGVNENADDTNITNSYWDTETSGQVSSDGGTGKTTTEMKTEDTFAAWDFNATWSIRSLDSISYPYLQSVVQNPAPGIEITTYAGGDGTLGDPYQIANLSQLYKLSTDDTNWDKYYIQTADISAANTSTWNAGEGFSPIGNSSTNFTGSYNGQHYTIDSLFINRSSEDYQGMFGYKTDGELTNIVLTNVDITGDAWIGGIVGRYGDGTTTAGLIDSCSVSGGTVTATFNGQVRTGGLAGLVSGGINVTNSHTDVVVAGEERLGGLIGEITVENSLIGTKGIVENCYALGDVNGTARQSAGLIGYMNINTILRTSYATGDVTGTDVSTGGLVGYTNTGTVVENCYALGNVTGEVHVGGLIGYNRSNVTNCYSTGTTSGTSSVGAFIGTLNAGTVSDCFWDQQASGSSVSAAGTAKNTAQLKVEATFTNWDFASTWDIRTTDSVSYPYLTDITPTLKPGIQLPTATWLGTDTVWSNTANWLTGAIPGSSDDVTINATDNDPVISNAPASPAETNALTIDANATLTLNSNKALTVNSDLTNNGILTLESGATIITKGTVGGSGTNTVKQDLTGDIEEITVSGAGVAAVNGNYTLISEGVYTNGTNSIYKYGSFPGGGWIIFDGVNAQDLYQGITVTADDKPQDVTFTSIDGANDPAPNVTLSATTGTLERNHYIGSPVAAATAAVFDNGTESKFYHNPTEQRYYTLDDATTLNPLQGYVYRSADAQTVEFTGALNTGALSNNNLPRVGTSNNYRGYNLVSNPYPSFIDWKLVSKTNLVSTIWLRTFTGLNNVFDTYNATGGIGTNNNGSGAVDEFIAPMQGFWVRVDADGNTGEISFDNTMRSHQADGGLEQEHNILRFVITDGTNKDEAIINFDNNADSLVEAYDSRKMYSNIDAQIATVVDGEELVINSLPESEATSVPVKVNINKDGLYTLEATEQLGNLQGTNIYLEDLYTNQTVNFNAGDKYIFDAKTTDSDRFVVHFNVLSVSTNDVAVNESILIFGANKDVVVQGKALQNAQLSVFNLGGKLLKSATLNGTQNIIPLDLSTGVYLVEVNNQGTVSRAKVILK